MTMKAPTPPNDRKESRYYTDIIFNASGKPSTLTTMSGEELTIPAGSPCVVTIDRSAKPPHNIKKATLV
jgi:hypothetical protein